MCKQNLHYYLLVSHFHMTFNLYPELLQKSFTHHHFFCLSCSFAIRCLWRWQLLFCLCISRATRDAPISWLLIITWARRWPITKWCITYCYADQPKQCTSIRGVKHPILDVLPFFSLKCEVCNFARTVELSKYFSVHLSIPTTQILQQWVNQCGDIGCYLFAVFDGKQLRMNIFCFVPLVVQKLRKLYL